jgi:hypothetical protein
MLYLYSPLVTRGSFSILFLKTYSPLVTRGSFSILFLKTCMNKFYICSQCRCICLFGIHNGNASILWFYSNWQIAVTRIRLYVDFIAKSQDICTLTGCNSVNMLTVTDNSSNVFWLLTTVSVYFDCYCQQSYTYPFDDVVEISVCRDRSSIKTTVHNSKCVFWLAAIM